MTSRTSSTLDPEPSVGGETLAEYLDRQCERYGLPTGAHNAGQAAMLLRHIMNNNAAIVGTKDYSIRALEERLQGLEGND